MLTPEEQKFVVYWEKNREKEGDAKHQFLYGVPYGLLFSLPIVINFLAGRFWYKRADAVGMTQFNPLVLVLAVMIITVFIAVFYKKHKWDQYEQRYKELRSKE